MRGRGFSAGGGTRWGRITTGGRPRSGLSTRISSWRGPPPRWASGEAGLTPTQLGVVEALLHLGPLGQRVLGDKLLMSGGNITTVVDNLERRGLVRRERRGDDRRHVTVHLTPEGRRLISRVFPGHVAAIVEAFSALSAAEQAQLGRLAKKLGRSLSRPGSA